MADGADFALDTSKLDRDGDDLVRAYLRAGTVAVQTTTRRLEHRLEDLVRDAAGGKLWRAVQSTVYPRRAQPAQNPVGEIWVKGSARTTGAFKFWTEPGKVRNRSGGWMPVPLPAAGGRNRQGIIDPHVWEMSHPQWRLDLLWQDGRRPLLVAHRRDKRREGGRGRSGGITEGQPIFALVPDIAQRNAVAIEPQVRRAEGELGTEFEVQARKV